VAEVMGYQVYRLSRKGELPTHWAYALDVEPEEGFQVWIHEWRLALAVLGFDQDGFYPPSEYPVLLVIKASEVHDGLSIWGAIKPKNVISVRKISSILFQKYLKQLSRKIDQDDEDALAEFFEDREKIITLWLKKNSKTTKMKWVETF
jgi:hypothetical protein